MEEPQNVEDLNCRIFLHFLNRKRAIVFHTLEYT